MKRLAVLLVLLASLAPLRLAAEPMPDQLVRMSIEKINFLLKVNRSAAPDDPRRLYAMLDLCEDVLPHIDFRGMSRFVLGPRWREATESQRERFTHEFRNLLIRIYGSGLHQRRDQRVVYLPFFGKPGDKTAVVKTEVRSTTGGSPIAIDYSFYRAPSIWKLYDITIDGVSLVTIYRITYAELIRKQGIDAFIATIARSNNRLPDGRQVTPQSAEPPPAVADQ